jgi:hypothetical protein
VRATRANDFFLTITESRKRQDGDGYDRHKVFLYKEDMNKFINDLTETINYVKNELMPDYDFDEFSNQYDENGEYIPHTPTAENSASKEAETNETEAGTVTPKAKTTLDDMNWEV